MDVREVANYLLNHCFLPSQAEDLLEKHYYAVNHLEELRRIFKPLGYTVVYHSAPLKVIALVSEYEGNQTSVYKGYKQDKIEMRGDRAEMSDFPLYLNTVAGGLDRRDQTIGGFSFVVKIYAVPVVEIIG